MPRMEGGGGGQDCRGNSLYSQIHGHCSEKSSGAKTPKTPNQRDVTPNYNYMYLSGRSSRERTPSARHGSGEKTPTGFDHRLPPGCRSSGDKTPRENEHRALNERNRIVERTYGERSSHKCERQTEGDIRYDSEDDEKYNQKYPVAAHHGRSEIVAVSRRQSFHRVDKRHEFGRAASAHRKVNLSKSMEFKSRHKQNNISDDASTDEDSSCTMFRGQWNTTPAGMNSELISTSQVSNVRRSVQAQAKALIKSSNVKETWNDERTSDTKSSKITNLTQQKAVAAVLAFQRWRHTQLKKLFSMELKKLLEEAKEDEACLATLEQELAAKNKHLAQLRSQLTEYEKSSLKSLDQSQVHEFLSANVQELEKECHKAMERASLAEEVLKKRDAEVLRLRERLRSVDEEGVRIDSELQANIKLLQTEKESALGENRVLLGQLARRDEEVAKHCKEIEKLRTTIAHLSDRQTSQQKQIESMKVDHQAQVQNLEEKLEQAYAAKQTKEMELVSYTERCSGLGQERQNLLVQLHRAVERADLASRRAEELQMKLHCTTEERVKASEDVAGEMVEHLKRLTGHMKELETSVDRTALCLPAGALQKKAGLARISAKLAQAEVDTLNLISDAQSFKEDKRPPPLDLEESRRQVCFSLDNKNRGRQEKPHRSTCAIIPFQDKGDTCNISSIDRDIALTKFKNWAAWKWRWAASAARADSLLKQLQNQSSMQKYNFVKENESNNVARGSAIRERTKELVKKLDSSWFDLSLPDERKVEALIMKHKLLPLILSAWRAFTHMSSLERKATSRNEYLNKIISALPWWIRRVGERRLLERYFFHWQLLALRANRDKSQLNQKKKIVPYVNPIFQSRLRDRDVDPPQAQYRPQTSRAASPAPARDAEVQTAGVSTRRVEGEWKQKTSSLVGAVPLRAAIPRLYTTQRLKSDPKTVPIPCPTCDIRRKFSGSVQAPLGSRNVQSFSKVDPKSPIVNETTFTARALRALQSSLQQELRELQYLLSQEMQSMQEITPTNADDRGNGGGVDLNRQALKSVFEVCNNLAQALVGVRSQLSGPENVDKTRGESPLLTTPRTPRCGIGEKGARGPMTREKLLMSGRPSSTSGSVKGPPHSSPTGREKPMRFTSPGWQPQETTAPTTRDPQNTPRSGSPSTRQLREREARVPAPSTTRELRDIRARQDRQHAYENSSRISRRQSPQETDERGDGGTDQRYLASSSAIMPGREGVRFAKGVKTMEREVDGDDTPLPPDYTTVVQILNQDNSKIGEVAIHTSAAAGCSRPADRGGIADLCSTAREAIRTEDQKNFDIRQGQHQSQLQTQQQRTPTPQQLADESIYAASQQNFRLKSDEPNYKSSEQNHRPKVDESFPKSSSQSNYRLKSAFKSPTQGPSTPPVRDRSHYQSILKGQVDVNSSKLDSSHYLSLKKKHCMGSEYADLLKSEILRLRGGRLMIEDDSRNAGHGEGGGGEPSITPRELTPRCLCLANRPSWRPHFTK